MRHDTERQYRERILRVLIHIQAHLDDALSLDELAGVAHFSPFHFHRIFRGMVGESVMEHVRRLRLERAAGQLTASDVTVTGIAFDAGYETLESFTRAFKTMFGVPPSAFRETRRKALRAASPSGVHYAPGGTLDQFTMADTEDGTMDVRTETVDPMKVVFMRHVGPYVEVGPTWEKLMAWAGPRGLMGPSTKCLGISHDDPDVTPADKIRSDACVVVDREIETEGDVGRQEIPGGEYAVVTHRGPYEELNRTWKGLMGGWFPKSGREPGTGPCFEVYRNSPQTAKPEDLLTDIYVPLK